MEVLQGWAEATGRQQLEQRRALAARDNQAVGLGERVRRLDQMPLNLEGGQHPAMRRKIPLQG
jgi:hypothetical protein